MRSAAFAVGAKGAIMTEPHEAAAPEAPVAGTLQSNPQLFEL
jgi:hypothetical protein